MIPLLLLPLIEKLASSGLNLIGNAVLNKGKDVIEEKLGVKLDDMVETEEGRQKLLQLQNDHEEELLKDATENRKIDLEFYKVDAENTANARGMNTAIQESAEATWIAKTLPYWLDILIVAGTFILAFMLFIVKIPEENQQIANITLGALITLCGTVVNFHRGGSAGSVRKDATIANLSKGAEK